MSISAKKINLLLTAGIGFTGFMTVGLVLYGMAQHDLTTPKPDETIKNPPVGQVDTNPAPSAVTVETPDPKPAPAAALPVTSERTPGGTYDGRLTHGGAPGASGSLTNDAFDLRFQTEPLDKNGSLQVEGLGGANEPSHLIGHDATPPAGSKAHIQEEVPLELRLKKKK